LTNFCRISRNKTLEKTFLVKTTILYLPLRDSISRPVTPQAETIPLHHAAGALIRNLLSRQLFDKFTRIFTRNLQENLQENFCPDNCSTNLSEHYGEMTYFQKQSLLIH
jgi:hypothetical protein